MISPLTSSRGRTKASVLYTLTCRVSQRTHAVQSLSMRDGCASVLTPSSPSWSDPRWSSKEDCCLVGSSESRATPSASQWTQNATLHASLKSTTAHTCAKFLGVRRGVFLRTSRLRDQNSPHTRPRAFVRSPALASSPRTSPTTHALPRISRHSGCASAPRWTIPISRRRRRRRAFWLRPWITPEEEASSLFPTSRSLARTRARATPCTAVRRGCQSPTIARV
mmetsp:Transcript_238/g.492  ORF Transcript_238/g.492 Transcript_238/m.492 type:complete len:223 (+) Transcript_238:333-1001(+)